MRIVTRSVVGIIGQCAGLYMSSRPDTWLMMPNGLVSTSGGGIPISLPVGMSAVASRYRFGRAGRGQFKPDLAVRGVVNEGAGKVGKPDHSAVPLRTVCTE